jgi:hypothetical protein
MEKQRMMDILSGDYVPFVKEDENPF